MNRKVVHNYYITWSQRRGKYFFYIRIKHFPINSTWKYNTFCCAIKTNRG